jgi:hypothetical protein
MMTAMVAIISIILIFLFVGRKALPVFTFSLDGCSIHSRQAWMERKSRPDVS